MPSSLDRARVLTLLLCAAALSAEAQQGPINPRIPPPPPSEEPAPVPPVAPLPPILPAQAVAVPATLEIPAGTRIAVELETPLSTRITKTGQTVTFRSAEAIQLDSGNEVPPQTAFIGSVVKASRPGRFGRAGELRVKIDRLELPAGASIGMVARLDSADANGGGRISSDHNRAADLYSLASWTLQGTLVGSSISGGKGAAIGAGAGAALALIMLASRRGPDIYLEPGMPFQIIVDKPVTLPGAEVVAAQQEYARLHRRRDIDADSTDPGPTEIRRDPDGAVLDSDRPKLKRRPKNP